MPGALEAVHVGMGDAVDQVVEVAVAEDRIGRAPQHERRHLKGGDAVGDALELGEALVRGIDRDVGHEPADALTAIGRAVGGAVGVLDLGGQPRGGERERRLEERRRGDRRRCEHPAGAGEPQRRRDGHALRVVHRGVEQRDPGEQLRVVDRPAQRDHAAPVVPEGDDRTFEAQRIRQRTEVEHALRERAVRAGALREAHLELVDGDDAPGGSPLAGGHHRRAGDGPPQVGPHGVAVHGEDRAGDRHAEALELTTRVEHVPLKGDPRIRPPARHAQQAAPARLEARHASGRQRRGRGGGRSHQASSIMAVLRPEPTPMSSTRSPRFRVACSSASVIGMDAGPTLP